MTPSDRDDLLVRLSRDVDALMRQRQISQRGLARRADVSDQTVLNILKARQDAEVLVNPYDGAGLVKAGVVELARAMPQTNGAPAVISG